MPARHLAAWRRNRGLTQEQLASRMNVNKSTISRYESGLRDMDQETLERIASALDIKPVALFYAPTDPPHALAVDRFARLVDEIGPDRAKALLDGMGAPD